MSEDQIIKILSDHAPSWNSIFIFILAVMVIKKSETDPLDLIAKIFLEFKDLCQLKITAASVNVIGGLIVSLMFGAYIGFDKAEALILATISSKDTATPDYKPIIFILGFAFISFYFNQCVKYCFNQNNSN